MNRHNSIAGSIVSGLRGFSHGRNSRNLKIIAVIVIAITALSFALPLSLTEKLVVAVTILAVLGTELFNTAIEELCDVVTIEHHEGIARVKELASAGVLTISIGAILVGLYIFIPYIFK